MHALARGPCASAHKIGNLEDSPVIKNAPGGYHWVQSGGDYLLVAIATGIIADLLLNR